ncbi:JmjC domain, hydroxylase-domain-containing protein [Pelagophyceae sp. CCMP2097]|nr:JmjC domain, hydroxylase-domain-containing protein [Pelagophyceae sp. CCMP2097]
MEPLAAGAPLPGAGKRPLEEERFAAAVAAERESKRAAVGAGGASTVAEAPTFRPTALEFLDPLAYIESIRAAAEPFGICKIVPPEGWAPPCKVDGQSQKRFPTKKQRVDTLQESRPFADGRQFTLMEYQQMADKFLADWLKPPAPDAPAAAEAPAAADMPAGAADAPAAAAAPPLADAAVAAALAQHGAGSGGEAGSGGAAAPLNAEGTTTASLEGLTGAALELSLETDYWRLVDGDSRREVNVEYGNDLDVETYWSGFERLSAEDSARLSADFCADAPFGSQAYYARCGWNLNNIARWPSSVLRHLQVQLPGVNLPWLYVGMLFATFSWHNEDNYLYSINYNHVGCAKQWYGVPGASADAFERVARILFQQRLQEVPELLHHMTTQFNPGKIREMDVPVYRLRQGAGEFVVTFPRAFHSGFSYGFNVGEAVNFATAAWIDHAKLANERYRRLGRLAVLSHDRLIFTLAHHAGELDLEAARLLEHELRRIIHEEDTLRPRLYEDGVRDVSRVIQAPPNDVRRIDTEACDYDDKRVCTICRHTCFLSAVACNCSQQAVVCLRHVKYLCQCPPTNKYLIEWESKQHLETVLAHVEQRCKALAEAAP